MEDVGIGIFEERFDIFFGNDLRIGVEYGFVVDGIIGSYYYLLMDGVKRVRGEISGGGDSLIE